MMNDLPETVSKYTMLILNQGQPDYTSSLHCSKLMDIHNKKIFKTMMLGKPRMGEWQDSIQ